jgi:hypothetical protein
MTPEERAEEALSFIGFGDALDHLTATRLRMNVIAAIRAAEYDVLTRAEDEFEEDRQLLFMGSDVIGRLFDLKSQNLGVAPEPCTTTSRP